MMSRCCCHVNKCQRHLPRPQISSSPVTKHGCHMRAMRGEPQQCSGRPSLSYSSSSSILFIVDLIAIQMVLRVTHNTTSSRSPIVLAVWIVSGRCATIQGMLTWRTSEQAVAGRKEVKSVLFSSSLRTSTWCVPRGRSGGEFEVSLNHCISARHSACEAALHNGTACVRH